MKTLIMNVKFGVILTGLIVLTSCGINSTLLSVTGINAINHTLTSWGHRNLKSTATSTHTIIDTDHRKGMKEKKDVMKTERSFKVMPISIGMTESAPLVSSPL